MTRSVVPEFVSVLVAAALLAPWPVAADGLPSANAKNRERGWGHVEVVATSDDAVRLEFVSTRRLYSCFEYRSDGDASEVIEDNEGRNYNAAITDGLYPYFCQYNSTRTETIPADRYVEVRLVFGDDPHERFGWTRFEVEASTAGAED